MHSVILYQQLKSWTKQSTFALLIYKFQNAMLSEQSKLQKDIYSLIPLKFKNWQYYICL